MTEAPKRIWAVYAEGYESRDEMPEIFASEEVDELRQYEKCYESPAQKYIRAAHYDALVKAADELAAWVERLDGYGCLSAYMHDKESDLLHAYQQAKEKVK